jgi:hypothetical protein
MKYVLDASVAVATLRASELGHADAIRRCMPLFAARRTRPVWESPRKSDAKG